MDWINCWGTVLLSCLKPCRSCVVARNRCRSCCQFNTFRSIDSHSLNCTISGVAAEFSNLSVEFTPTVNMMRLGESVAPGGEVSKCDRLHRALSDCHQKIPPGPPRQAACRHLNRSLAECLVSVACPEESDAVRSLCSSSGTALKRHQCQQAQLSLSVCLSSHQSGSNF